ncbi:UDP-galactopyranose mutase [Octadecabacter sp. G9-8]|uniref:UDP-galactopyranose mutase n=1 Tax=Octadecabacter dasysiphoniae TaxID=2909341 RepID=A0ABS9CV72_9RHOB|nr:UDP-galactopyranose mutase [Octadecabacter dasysiphoniae]MCF2870962.1 UDP-galactopyranose mutase [Octadecabacter dasysiphoniae]
MRGPVTIAGAGLSGAVLARELADAGYDVTVYEARDHVAGNCYTERHAETGVLVHRYGPHIFHTDDAEVWDYVNRFGAFRPYAHRVWSKAGGTVFPMPISLATINQFFGSDMGPDAARDFIDETSEDIAAPHNFEEQALSMVGRALYEAFFEGYTRKQWGCAPRDLPAAILKRLPLRFSYDDGYFAHRFQGMPEEGYTPVIEAMLNHPRIAVRLSTPLNPGHDVDGHVFWSGAIDAYFYHSEGRLGYRTLDFENEVRAGDYQGCAVMNYADGAVPYTRITEHKHFAPWEAHEQTVITREMARACGPDDVPYYPIRLATEKAMLHRYIAAAKATRNVTFVGRLGTYRYLDMDVCVREAIDVAEKFINADLADQRLGAFIHAPIDPLTLPA